MLAFLYDALPFGSVTRAADLVYDDHLDNPVTILLVAMTTLSQFDSFCGEDAKLRRRVFFTRHGQQLRQQLQHRVRWLQWNCIVKRMKTRASSTEAQPKELRARTFNNELNVDNDNNNDTDNNNDNVDEDGDDDMFDDDDFDNDDDDDDDDDDDSIFAELRNKKTTKTMMKHFFNLFYGSFNKQYWKSDFYGLLNYHIDLKSKSSSKSLKKKKFQKYDLDEIWTDVPGGVFVFVFTFFVFYTHENTYSRGVCLL